MYYPSIIIIITSTLMYHIIQKSTPRLVSPIVTLFVTYATATLLCLILYPFFRQNDGILLEIKKLNWTSYALGVVIFGIELGFLYAYRTGWNLSTANLFTMAMVSSILIPIGIVIYKEKISLVNAVGIILCIVGVGLINKR